MIKDEHFLPRKKTNQVLTGWGLCLHIQLSVIGLDEGSERITNEKVCVVSLLSDTNLFCPQERRDLSAVPCLLSPRAWAVEFSGSGSTMREDGLRTKPEPPFCWSTATRPGRARPT